MKKLLLAIVAALGALAFWRRDTLKDDVGKAGDAVKSASEKVRSRGTDEADADASAPDDAAAPTDAPTDEASGTDADAQASV